MKRLFILTALVICASLTGCTEISDISEEAVYASATVSVPTAYPVTAGGFTFNEAPATAASLSPAVTEILYEIGAADRLICRSSYCDHPEQALSLPDAGSGANPDFDRIIELAPSLLITQSPIANKDVSRLSDAGIAVMIMPAPKSVEELYSMYSELALIFFGGIEGEKIAQSAVSELKAALDSASGSCESLVFILNITDDGFMAATGDTFAGSFIGCFGENIAADKTGYFITAEELISADPQAVFLADPLSASDIPQEIAAELSAFSDGHIYRVDASLMERPTSRLTGVTNRISEAVRSDIANG